MGERRPYYVVISYRLRTEIPIGIILVDPGQDLLVARFRERWDFAEADDRELLAELWSDLVKLGQELGPEALIAQFEDTLSNTLVISDRHYLEPHTDLQAALTNIFQREIKP